MEGRYIINFSTAISSVLEGRGGGGGGRALATRFAV